MLDFVFIGFLVLGTIVFILSAMGDDPKPTDAILTVTGETKGANKISSGTYEYTYEELKTRPNNVKFGEYFGPVLNHILTNISLEYSSVLIFSADSKKVQRLLQKKETEDWIVAVDKDEKPLSWQNDGPFLLLNTKDKTKRVPRLLRIETK